MQSECQNCAKAAQVRTWGGYTMTCPRCCARLVRSARPLRHAQEAHFAAIARYEGAPTKQKVIEAIAAMDKGQ